MSQLLKSSGAMSAATMASRVLGLLRETVYAGFMGDGWVAGAFKLAFMVPNLLRRLLGEGALTAAFIPIFKETEKTQGEAEVWRATNAVLSGLVVTTAGIVALSVLLLSVLLETRFDRSATMSFFGVLNASLPWVAAICLLALGTAYSRRKGFVSRFVFNIGVITATLFIVGLLGAVGLAKLDFQNGQTLLMLELLRAMFPYVLLVCIAAVFMALLNARGHFFVPALGATMLNVVMIASVYFLAPLMGPKDHLDQQIFGLAIGVVIAGFAQAGFQLPLLHREGFRYRWVSPWKNETVHRVVARMVPGTLGVAAYQLNVLITQGFAFNIGGGTVVASFDYAVRLLELPQGVFGISLATYLLPTLSGLAAEKKFPEFRSTLRHGLSWLVFVNLIASVLLLLLAEPIVRLLFQHGRFDASSTARAASALTCLAPGLLAFSLVNILARAFYALGDTMTPMRISVFCLAVNALLALALVGSFRQMGLGIANTCSAVVNFALLLYALRRKLKSIDLGDLLRQLPLLFFAAASAGLAAWGTCALWTAKLGHETFLLRLGEVFLPMIAASAVYLGLTYWLKATQAREVVALLAARLKR